MIILGLGSNVGNRLQYLVEAVKYIGEEILAGMTVSPVYECDALLKNNSPESWNKDFLNMAVTGQCHLAPDELLKAVKSIEKRIGRITRGSWAPREIDIDILAYHDLCIDSLELTVPHPLLCQRSFAIVPLADIAPNWRYPGNGDNNGKTAYQLCSDIQDMCNLRPVDCDIVSLIKQKSAA